jgi:glucose-1-phosphate thymidylyltransferase
VQAVILTAGRGTRLLPVTNHVPKPLIPFWGRPFVHYLLDNLLGRVDETVLVVAEDGELEAALGESYRGMPLRYVVQPDPEGTGDATLRARHILDEEFLLLLGDTCPHPETVDAIINARGEAAQTVIAEDDLENHLGVTFNDEFIVERLWADDACFVDAGMFRLTQDVCDRIEACEPIRGELRILQGLNALLEEGREVSAVELPQPWLQYGDHEGVSGVCRVMDQIRMYANGADEGRDSSIEITHSDCEISNSLVFGPGQLAGCKITDSLVYCDTRVEGITAHGEIVAWVDGGE